PATVMAAPVPPPVQLSQPSPCLTPVVPPILLTNATVESVPAIMPQASMPQQEEYVVEFRLKKLAGDGRAFLKNRRCLKTHEGVTDSDDFRKCGADDSGPGYAYMAKLHSVDETHAVAEIFVAYMEGR